jgi:hypothetical protein
MVLISLAPIGLFLVSRIAAWYLAKVIHEMGHVVADYCVSSRILRISVSPFHVRFRNHKVSMFVGFGLGSFVASQPTKLQGLRWRLLISMAGGPLGSLVGSVLCFAIPGAAGGRLVEFTWILGVFSGFHFVWNLLPINGSEANAFGFC